MNSRQARRDDNEEEEEDEGEERGLLISSIRKEINREERCMDVTFSMVPCSENNNTNITKLYTCIYTCILYKLGYKYVCNNIMLKLLS